MFEFVMSTQKVFQQLGGQLVVQWVPSKTHIKRFGQV